MNHQDDITTAVALLKQTLPEMNKRNIATTPENYAVWYEYVSNENKHLNDAIHDLDKKNAIYNDELLQSLYAEHIADAHESAVNQISASVREIIHEFLAKVNNEGAGLSEYAKALSEFATKMETVSSIDEIKLSLGHLLEETRKREDATQTMQTTLESMALEMKKLRAEVSKLNSEATTDTLTKVNNRRSFDIEVENFVAFSKSSSKPLCLLMIDIDHFKKFNDKFGTAIGDKVLRFVATLIKNNIKGGDSVSRFSGAQFAVLLPETSYEGALIVAENIRARLAKQTLSDSTEKIELGTVTASIGVSTCNKRDNAETLIRVSDKCMHDAKKTGRNKVLGDPSVKNETAGMTKTLI